MYTRALTLEQIADGRLKALRNAEELMSDALCLYRRRRWPRSLFLSQIAVEEAGKYFYLLSASVTLIAGEISWPGFWKSVRSHSDKTTLFLLIEDVLIPGPNEPKNISQQREEAAAIQEGKMWSLYSDYEQKEFFAPSEVVDRSLARLALRLALNRVRFAREFEASGDYSRRVRAMTADDIALYEEIVRRAIDDGGPSEA